MDMDKRHPMTQSRHLLRQLRRLGDIQAPATMMPAVLESIGLVDAFAPIETAIGPMFVAYNDRGISALMRAPSEADFAREFRLRFGRSLRRVAEQGAKPRRRNRASPPPSLARRRIA